MNVRTESIYLTNEGGEIHQVWEMLAPDMMAVAHHDGQTQKRSFGSRGISQQTGWEIFNRLDYKDAAPRIASEAIQLLEAPDCPTGKMDLILINSSRLHDDCFHAYLWGGGQCGKASY